MSPRRLVWNAAERRPRAPVRLLVAPVVVALVALLVGGAARLVVPPAPTLLDSLLRTVATFGALLLGGVLVARYVDRRTLADLGFHVDRAWAVDLCFGLALGAALMTGVFLVGLAAGWVAVVRVGFGSGRLVGVAALAVLFVLVGVEEELLVRGIVLTNVAEGLTWRLRAPAAVVGGLIVSSGLFGVAHLANPGATAASTLSISLAGVMLGLGYVLTDDLAIPIGLHVSWNFVQGAVYGFSVSGLGVGTSLVVTAERGPDLFTGGQFGPEAGLLGVGAVLLGTACIAAYVRRRRGELRFDPDVAVPALRWREEN